MFLAQRSNRVLLMPSNFLTQCVNPTMHLTIYIKKQFTLIKYIMFPLGCFTTAFIQILFSNRRFNSLNIATKH